MPGLEGRPIDQKSEKDFELLLSWLGPDREQAAQKYEYVRRCLIRYFSRNMVTDPLSLADEVLVRVTKKVEEVVPGYVGDPLHYFLAVARRVLAEWRRQPVLVEMPADIISLPVHDERAVKEQLLHGLEHCWSQLSTQEQSILLRYYLETPPHTVSESRVELARELGMSANALRVMTHRLRGKLRRCVERAVERKKHEMARPLPHK
jgi:RNA polymerase sigma factor (sigma-70 family)